MEKRVYNPPEEGLIRAAMKGDGSAILEVVNFYEPFIKFLLGKEINRLAGKIGIEREDYSFDDLLNEIETILLKAILDFRELKD